MTQPISPVTSQTWDSKLGRKSWTCSKPGRWIKILFKLILLGFCFSVFCFCFFLVLKVHVINCSPCHLGALRCLFSKNDNILFVHSLWNAFYLCNYSTTVLYFKSNGQKQWHGQVSHCSSLGCGGHYYEEVLYTFTLHKKLYWSYNWLKLWFSAYLLIHC